MLHVKSGILGLRQLLRRFQVFCLNGSPGDPSFQDIDLRLIDGLLLIFLIQQMLDLTVGRILRQRDLTAVFLIGPDCFELFRRRRGIDLCDQFLQSRRIDVSVPVLLYQQVDHF